MVVLQSGAVEHAQRALHVGPRSVEIVCGRERWGRVSIEMSSIVGGNARLKQRASADAIDTTKQLSRVGPNPFRGVLTEV